MSNPVVKDGSNIDQIRQLIFGEQQRDYDRKIAEIQKQIKDLRKQMTDSFAETQKMIDRLAEDKTDRLKLANYLIEVAMRLKGEDIMDQLSETSDKMSKES